MLGLIRRTFTVDNPWYSGTAEVPVYQLDELLGTKLRALYQRKKGRDLYDLWRALRTGEVDGARVVECCRCYLEHEGIVISRAAFEANLAGKLRSREFLEDVRLLIPPDAGYDPAAAGALVQGELIARLPGEPWRGGEG